MKINNNQTYKAIDLYKLTTREKGMFFYEGVINKEKQIKVKGFTTNTKERKKNVINFFLSKYSCNKNITQKILSNTYVIGLFKDSEPKNIIFLLFGQNKDILEKFNKKIHTSKFSSLFDQEEIILPTIREEKIEEKNELRKRGTIKAKNKIMHIADFELKELYNNKRAQIFIETFPRRIKSIKDIIQNEDKFNLSLNTIEQNLQQYSEMDLKEILKSLNSLNIPRTNIIKKKILGKLVLKEAFNSGKRRRESILNHA